MSRNPAEEFRAAIGAAGLAPPDAIEPGRFHRFPGAGKRNGNTAGWCKLFPDGRGGVFGDFATGAVEDWRGENTHLQTPAEREGFRRSVAEAKAAAQAKRKAEHDAAARSAARLWNEAAAAPNGHGYLNRKGVLPHGVRMYRGVLSIHGMPCDGALLVPIRNGAGELRSLQFIAAEKSTDGDDKRYIFSGERIGCYHSIGRPNGLICIVEGYATGASVHEATDYAVAIAFDARNLKDVAIALRAKYPALQIVICADDDYRTAANPGLTKATEAALAVHGLLAVPDFGSNRPERATDFNDLAAHRGHEAVERAIARAKPPEGSVHQPTTPNATVGDMDSSPWPEALDEAALYGIAGEFVRMIEPNTEADPAAILVQFLLAFGALVGRGPHYKVEGDEHHANLYALLIGATAKARKGTSWGRVREVYKRIPDWKPNVSGLSSGEGLKYHVRDAREETKPNKHGELIIEVVDEGVTDKRLLVVESEFASALRAAQRQGSTLSATIREGWDSGNLRTLTKHDPITATGAHICIVGHITADELRAELTATDSANGFANRFLFIAVKRSKPLPFGGDPADEGEAQAFADRLWKRATTARARRQLEMTADARIVWAKVYPHLSAGGEGLHGAVTARAEAQVIRLALVYCLLDEAEHIDVAHILAALAVWQYCDATAKHVFGASLGDRAADEIMRRLHRAGEDGLTRTDIRDLFGRHLSADRIGVALDLLRRKGRATCETVSTGGRPTEVWRVTK